MLCEHPLASGRPSPTHSSRARAARTFSMAARRSGTTLAARWRRRALVRTLVSIPLVLLTFFFSSLATLRAREEWASSRAARACARREVERRRARRLEGCGPLTHGCGECNEGDLRVANEGRTG